MLRPILFYSFFFFFLMYRIYLLHVYFDDFEDSFLDDYVIISLSVRYFYQEMS